MATIWYKAYMLALGLSAMIVSALSFDYSLKANLRRSSPETAYAQYPNDPRVVASAMSFRFKAVDRLRFDRSDEANLRTALLGDPLNRSILRTLGAVAELNGDTGRALIFMKQAHRVSRRDSITELWLANYFLKQNEFDQALRHFDALARVHAELSEAFYPMLAEKMQDSRFQKSLRKYLKANKLWVGDFALYALNERADVSALWLYAERPFWSEAAYSEVFQFLIRYLAVTGQAEKAIYIAEGKLDGFDVRSFGNLDITKATLDERLGTLSWIVNYDYPARAEVVDSSYLEFDAGIDDGIQVFAREFILRPSTEYDFRFIGSLRGDGNASVRWNIACNIGGTTKTLVDRQFMLSSRSKIYRQKVIVPSGCSLAKVSLISVGNDSREPYKVVIKDIALELSRL